MGHGLSNQFLYAVTNITVNYEQEGKLQSILGTGFFIVKDNKTYLITNNHILNPNYGESNPKPFIIKLISFDSRSFDTSTRSIIYSSNVISNCQTVFDDNDFNDVACIYNIQLRNNQRIDNIRIPYDMLASQEDYDKSLSVCDQVAIIGFPVNADKQNHMPILRTGYISSDPRLDYSYDATRHLGQCVAYEAYAKPGFSGSPVFTTQVGFEVSGILSASEGFYRPVKLVGIQSKFLTEKVSFGTEIYKEHSQLSIFYKSTIIKSLIDKAIASSTSSN